MDLLDTISKMSSLLIAFVTLVIVLAKMHNQITVLEEKLKALFDLVNKNTNLAVVLGFAKLVGVHRLVEFRYSELIC